MMGSFENINRHRLHTDTSGAIRNHKNFQHLAGFFNYEDLGQILRFIFSFFEIPRGEKTSKGCRKLGFPP